MIFLFHQFVVVLLYTSITYFLLFPYAENISFLVVRPLKIIAPHSKARTRTPNYKAMDQVAKKEKDCDFSTSIMSEFGVHKIILLFLVGWLGLLISHNDSQWERYTYRGNI